MRKRASSWRGCGVDGGMAIYGSRFVGDGLKLAVCSAEKSSQIAITVSARSES